MSYPLRYAESAKRHRQAADLLFDGPRKEVAGYLYGIAAECAVKRVMQLSGMNPLPESQRREDAFYAHFPTLKTLLSRQVQGRRHGELEKLSRDGSFMREWDTDMRYAGKADIDAKLIGGWRADAERAVNLMDGP